MADFYENYLRLCNKVQKSPSAVALEIGITKTAVSNWKARRTNPTDATARKVANYFGVSVEALMSENENKPAPESELTNVQQQAVELVKGMTDDQLRVFIATAKAMLGE